MSNRAFLVVIIVVGVIVAAAVFMHSPAGAGMRRTVRTTLHGGGD